MNQSMVRILFAMLMLAAFMAASRAVASDEISDTIPRTSSEKVPPAGAVAPKGTAATQPAEEPIAEEVDLISDKPEAGTGAGKEIMAAYEPSGPMIETGRKAFALMAEMKTHVDQIAKDLDGGGKEITRLTRTSDLLAKCVSDIAEVWPYNADFRDRCGTAKRTTLMLNEELARVPRKWTHVRWAFNQCVKDVRKVRYEARELAEAEPRATAVTGKDGKVTYVDPVAPPVDPAIAEREKKIAEVDAAKARLKRAEEARRNKPMPIDVEDK